MSQQELEQLFAQLAIATLFILSANTCKWLLNTRRLARSVRMGLRILQAALLVASVIIFALVVLRAAPTILQLIGSGFWMGVVVYFYQRPPWRNLKNRPLILLAFMIGAVVFADAVLKLLDLI